MGKAGGSSSWIDAEAAIQVALRGIEKIDLTLLQSAEPTAIGSPRRALLVTRLDQAESAYYLVPWESEEGVGLIARVDAAAGEMLGAATVSSPTPYPFLSSERAVEILRCVYPTHEIGEPRLVWKPCRESTSPFRPLFQFRGKDESIYMDMDGGVFKALTPLGRGG